jgi:tetratricopeptide (TPR) repeat protein
MCTSTFRNFRKNSFLASESVPTDPWGRWCSVGGGCCGAQLASSRGSRFAERNRPHAPQIAISVVYLLVFLSSAGDLGAEDVVTVRNVGSQQVHRLRGEVVDYTGKELTLRRQEREERIPAERVVDVETTWSEPQRQAQARTDQGALAEAVPLWRDALQQESRAWVRRLILARLARCYFELGQFDLAGDMFQALVQSDPQTPYLDAMPIVWGEIGCPPSLESRARRWTESALSPVQLMGAAWLVASSGASDAQMVLSRLTRDPDPRVAWLATVQLWRTELRSRSASESISQWESSIERMPVSLRAGPYFVLGQAYQWNNDSRAAVLAYLRVPILYPEQRRLASHALWSAATILEKSDSESARMLLREIVERYPETTNAQQARLKLEK